MAVHFFNYGSLSSDGIHFPKFFSNSKVIGFSKILASVYRLEVGYPVVVKNGTSSVPGELVACDVSDSLMALLDEFHGFSQKNPEKSLYTREEIEVFFENEKINSFCYFLNPLKLPRSAKMIADGDWQKEIHINPPFTKSLSPDEREYILRLGNSSGRDIVPYQLNLYRDLTKKGIIVDKGRRLALTKFGQEIFRFLE